METKYQDSKKKQKNLNNGNQFDDDNDFDLIDVD
jgi:hypothetical protein